MSQASCAKFGTCHLPPGHAGVCLFSPTHAGDAALLVLAVGVKGDRVIVAAGRGSIELTPDEAAVTAAVLLRAAVEARGPEVSAGEVH